MAKNKRKIKNTCFYLASFHKIIVPTNCSRVDNRFSIRIRNSDPIESARIAFNHRPWNNLFSTSHAHWIRDSTRRFNSKKKKKKKKTLLARRKRVGVTITPSKHCMYTGIRIYIQNAPYDGIRCLFVSIRCWTKRNERWVYLVARNATLKYCREPRI